MNRIDQAFLNLQAEGKKAFISYICGCDPDFDQSLEALHGLAESGVDILEIGVPFSDPLADGIVNQQAAARALKSGANVREILQLVKEFRKTKQTPIVLFTYLNPIYTYGFEQFQRDALEAGVDGILILDLTPDEAMHSSGTEFAMRDGLAAIRLIAPTTPVDRINHLVGMASGFIYALSRAGVTGMHASPSVHISEQVLRIREKTNLPVCIGFGISTPEQAKEIAQLGDGVIVGSAIVKELTKYHGQADLRQQIQNFVRPMVQAVKSCNS